MTTGYGRQGYLHDLWTMHGTLYDAGADERIGAEVLAALEDELGPMECDPLPAVVVDGAPDEATLQEIGDALGVCRERARCIIVQAQRSFAKSWVVV